MNLQKEVKGEGNEKAKMWIIGEAPGVQEEKQGRPFVGGAGRVLDGILQEGSIQRSETYIDNVVQKRPPNNNFGFYYEDKARRRATQPLLDAHERLKEKVRLHHPNVVVALGNEALFALTGKKQIMKWRGSILGCHGVKVVPTVHPAMVMRQYEFKPVAVLDFKRAKRESLTPKWPEPYHDQFLISPTYDQVMDTLEFLHKQPHVAFDIETGQNQITCIGFAWSKTQAMCVPIFFGENSWWTAEEENAIIFGIRKLFADPSVKFIAQNAQYDMIFLADKWGVEVANLWMDTMIAFHCVYPELRKGLDFLCSIYTNRPYYKGMLGEGGPENLWTYNCLDTVVTWECAHEIRKEMEEFGTLSFYETHSHQLIAPLICMQRRGVKIDLTKRAEIDKNLEKEVETMQERLIKAVGHELNVGSPKQMKDFLYKEMKLPPQRNRKTGSLTADEDAIQVLAKKFPSPIFDLILDIRKVRKLLSTYIRAPLDNDGRIRCSYDSTGTETGRLASRASVYGSGTNLQNIPRGEIVRSIFVPDTGKRFVNADLSQAEARVVAYLAKEGRLQVLFEEVEGDVHKRNAAMVFGKKIEEVSAEERELAKTLVHAANYGIGARTFSRTIGSTEQKARELLNQYFAFYPGIKLWHREVGEKLKRSRIMTTPFGRKRMFFARWGPELIREALAYVPQSTVGDLLNLGIIGAYPNLPPGWTFALQLHDAVLMQVPVDADPMHIYKFIKHYFEIWIDIDHQRLKIPVDIKVGMNWAELKPLEI